MTTPTPHIADTSPHDWKYISEGGSTIVFSYAGPAHPHFDGTALRLRKAPVPAPEDPEKYAHTQSQRQLPTEGESENEAEEPDDPTIVFQRTVIERLVPREHLPRLDAVRVERGWLQELAGLTEPQRPLERRAKDRIDTGRRKAVLATDLVGGNGWAVEIKVRRSSRSTVRPIEHGHYSAAAAQVGLPPGPNAPLARDARDQDADVPLLHARAPQEHAGRGRLAGVLPARPLLGRRGARHARAACAVGRLDRQRGRGEQPARVRRGEDAQADC